MNVYFRTVYFGTSKKNKLSFKYVYLHHVKPAIEPPTAHDKQGALAGATTWKAGTDKAKPRTPTSPPSPAHTGYRYKEGLMHCQLRNS